MFKLDIDKVKELHAKHGFKGPLLDAGGVANPTIADYEISKAKAVTVVLPHRNVIVPHHEQNDRYLSQRRPWEFIDKDYLILNPDDGQPWIEDLPKTYAGKFSTLILVSVMEHTNNPYVISDALFAILKPGGYLFNSVPFTFPYHPAPEDNWRFAPLTLKRIHEQSGFEVLESDWHVNYSTNDGIGDTNPNNYGAPQAIRACYALAGSLEAIISAEVPYAAPTNNYSCTPASRTIGRCVLARIAFCILCKI